MFTAGLRHPITALLSVPTVEIVQELPSLELQNPTPDIGVFVTASTSLLSFDAIQMGRFSSRFTRFVNTSSDVKTS